MSKIYGVRQYYHFKDNPPEDDGVVAWFDTREEAEARAAFEREDAKADSGPNVRYSFEVEEQDE